ncbi:gamma-glutamyltransferase [Thermoproteus tenax]|uniref:Gamma-glutamyltranspeptidase n=1 Tax=Thermoproteus tenax (strain ATCC 35583 / DSM 2078 / JCM 9277 / NBRC 100435 / Kra 1) TaxID=768679 RepID=G4RN91_THETK|nr:gamma-glutamyltransferase [Thermoproteus tenax]CCC81035.1 Gamma-glutamyltranspeptidase [Thermoproteus tenax Kra 1]
MSWGSKIAVASESYQATYLGMKIAELGGNEADVALAVSLALAYLLPHLNGLGGDFLALVERGGKVEAVMGLGWAPSGIGERPPRFGLASAVVPGMARGLWELHRRYGSLDWGKVVRTVADFLEREAVVHPSLAEALERAELEGPGSSLYRSIPRAPGERYTVAPLLSLYRSIADEGPDALYRALAASLSGELFAPEDFLQYRAEVREPLAVEHEGWTLYEAPPPSLGFAVLLTLKLADQPPRPPPLSYARIKSILSAARRAHWARDKYLGDCEIPWRELLEGRIQLSESERPTPTPGTTYFAVAGREMTISAIQSLYYAFGSRYVERNGVVLNNRASDFTDGPNKPGPRRRPAHTLSAVIALRGDRAVALGASAGHYRPVIYAQLIQNLLYYGMELRRAVWAPRFIWVEGWRAEAERGFEEGPGVHIVDYPSRMGVAAAAVREGKRVGAASDLRGDGAALAK